MPSNAVTTQPDAASADPQLAADLISWENA
jgi:hypothetical protein